MSFSNRLKAARYAAMWHLLGSTVVSLLLAVLVFGVWYPYPYRDLAGGLVLFGLVVGVDLVCGPLLTLVLFNPEKRHIALLCDLGLVVSIQLAALGYGLWSVSVARPVHVVFEVDRFRLITASEINAVDLREAPESLRKLPLFGPTLISVRNPRNGDEFLKSLDLSLAGQEPSLRPGWWQDYAAGLPQVLQRAQPLATLVRAYPEKKALFEDVMRKSSLSESDLLWLPLTSARTMNWVVFLNRKNGNPQGYAPIDGFL